MVTSLDKACDQLGDALNNVQQAEENFYEAFLNAELFFATKSADMHGASLVEEDGNAHLMLFDTKDRAEQSAEGDVTIQTAYGSDIIANFKFKSNTYIMLNEKTEHWKEFMPEEIEWLKSNIEED